MAFSTQGPLLDLGYRLLLSGEWGEENRNLSFWMFMLDLSSSLLPIITQGFPFFLALPRRSLSRSRPACQSPCLYDTPCLPQPSSGWLQESC